MSEKKVLLKRPNKEIYVEGDKLVKEFDGTFKKSDILNEAINQTRVAEAGLNVPQVLDVRIDKEGSYELSGVEINSIKSFHDPEGGRLRGENIIFKFSMDGIEVCHLGDIGEECSTELIESLLPVDVLLIPVGGTYTIDAEQAKEYVDRIMPDIVIPMHYREKGKRLDVDKVDDFCDLFEEEEVENEGESEIEISREDLGGDSTKIIVMERVED